MKKQLFLFVALLFVAVSSWAVTTRNVPGTYATIQAAIDASDPGDIIQVAAGTLVLPSVVNVNKAGLTIQGVSNTQTKIQVSGTGYRFNITASGVTIQNMEIEKTDKTGVQNIIGIQASNVTVKNNIIYGQFAITPAAYDGEVSRAIVISGGLSGLLIDNNQFYNLRQPAYVSGVTTGTVSNNHTYNTKGWVLEGGNLTFTGNTWGTGAQANVFDIAILNQPNNVGYYTDIVAMSNANNGAVIEDQRVSPAVLSVVYVDASTAFSSDLGGKYHPYSTIASAITRVVAGGTIKVAAGTYAEGLSINKSVTIEGPNSLVSPNTGSRATEAFLKPNSGSHALLGAANAVNFTLKGITIDMANTATDNRFVHIINFTDNSWSFKNNILKNAKECVNGNWYISGNTTRFNLALNDNLFTNSASSNGIALFSANTHNVDIQNNVWMNNATWAMNFNNVHGTIANNTFKNSVTPGAVWSEQQAGFIISSTNNDLVISGNKFESLSASAINFYDGAAGKIVATNNSFTNIANYGAIRLKVGSDVSRFTLTGNSFTNNLVNIQNLTTGTLSATCNWWGTAIASEITSKFVGSVTYAPYSVSEGGSCTGPPPTPITTIGTPTSSVCGIYDFPVTVQDFKNVGNISLTLNYNASVFEYQGVDLTSPLMPANANGANPGKFILGWHSLSGITLGDNAVLFTLHLKLLPVASGTTTNLTFSTVQAACDYSSPGTSGNSIEYASTFTDKPWTIPVRPVKNTTTLKEYCTIQAAINDPLTSDGHTITVAAGTYAEVVNVNKRIDLRGPNYGIDGNSGSRVTEAILVPPSELNATGQREWSTNPLVALSVNGVKIDGFRISGDNPVISGYSYAGMNVEAGLGILSKGNNIEFLNNVVDQFTYMGFHSAGTQISNPNPAHYKDLVIAHNKFDKINDLNQLGYGFAMYIQGSTAAVTYNTVTNSRTAIQVQPYDVIQIGATAPVVSNNNFSVWRNGIYYNYAENNASAWTITLNNITACVPPANPTGRVLWAGIAVETMRASSNGGIFLSNTIDGTGAVTDASKWWGVWGMLYKGDASTSTNVFFTNNTVSNVETGFAFSAPADIVLTGNSLTASGKAISVQHNYSSAGVDQGTGGANNINALGGNTINEIATSGASLTNLFTVEDAITHKIDESWRGLVSVKANKLFVTLNSFAGLNTTPLIKRAIDAAGATGWTVNVGPGTYNESVNVSKPISLVGAGSDPVTGSIITKTGGQDGAVNLNASGVSGTPIQISNFCIKPTGAAGISVGTFTLATDKSVSYVDFTNVKVIGTNLSPCTEQERGLYVDPTSSLSNVNITDCAFDNLHYGWYFQKQVSADASTVSNIIVVNTTFNHNNAKGIYAEKLSYATFTGCIIDGNGLYNADAACSYFNPWKSGFDINLKAGTYQNITIEGCAFTNNGKGLNGSVGTSQHGVALAIKARSDGTYGPFPATLNKVLVQNSIFDGNERGIRLGEPGKANPQPLNVVVTNNSFTNNVKTYSGTDGSTYGDIINVMEGSNQVFAECNWFGIPPSAGAIAAKISGSVDYTPWLINGTDDAPATPGFQPTANSCGGSPVVIASAVADNIICGESSGSIAVTFSGGTAPYNITWTGGSATSNASPYTITSLPAGVYSITITDANLSTATSSATVLYLPVTNTSSLPNPTYYPTIQAAIDVANTGNVITVCAGTYAEDIIVNKSVTILGPNATIEPCSGTRVAEAIVVPKTKAIASGEIFHVAASNVTIKGFTIDGDNPLLASGFSSTTSADIDAAEGITVYETGINNLTVTNNILKNLSYFGVTLYDPAGVPSSGHVISNNKFQDLGTYDATSGGANWGGGVLLYNNQYAAVANNCMNNVRLGIQTGNFYQANPGTAASQLISGNTIQARKRGVFHNLFYSSASPYTISNNIITGLANVNETTFWDGILLASMQQTASTASGNIIDGSAVTALPKTGIAVWNCQVAPLISGGKISGVGLGINVNNFESYPSTGSNAGNTSATIDGVAISGTTIAGVKVHDNTLNTNGATVSAEIKNVVISGTNATGILVSGADAGANIHDNTITASTAGISVTGTSTSSTVGLSIANNTINLASQLAGSNPTVGIALSKVNGTAAATISRNTISGSYYGYLVYNLNTLPKTILADGTITGVMQGVSAINIDPAGSGIYAPSVIGVSEITMSGFAGNHTALPNSNFHAGVYVFTGGAIDAAGITATIDKVSVIGTGKIQGDCAGLYFTDWSSNAVNMQNITVTECTLTNNLNRGIFVSGKNARANIGTSTLTGNGSDPYGLGGNDGFGIIVRKGAVADVHNCFITNPATVAGGYKVSALFTDRGTASNATINATENWLSQNGNTTSWLANNGGGTLSATCNWWNTTTPSNALIAATINGVVTYYPNWLISGVDASGSAGFQPQAGVCVGSPVVFTCGVDVTVSACSTQETVNAAYRAFLASTTASGCSGTLANNAPAAAPSICGGSVSVTWTYTSNCETVTCTRTFTVTSAPAITLICAANVTVASCQTQVAINSKFATWLGTVVASGGCSGSLSTIPVTPVAPSEGGSVTVQWTYTSTCAPLTTTCSATFTVAAKNTITGTIKYYNNARQPLNNVVIKLKQGGSVIHITTTDNNGSYTLQNVCPGAYDVECTTAKDVGGINSTDAGAVNGWFVSGGGGTPPVYPSIERVRFNAGDVNGDNLVLSQDAGIIQTYFINDSKPPFATLWKFWKEGESVTSQNPSPSTLQIVVPQASAPIIQNFFGLVNGDFNGSFSILGDNINKSAAIPALTLIDGQSVQVVPNETINLPVKAGSGMKVGAISLILNYPNDKLQVVGVYLRDNPDLPVTYKVSNGELRIGWNSLNPLSLASGETLLTVRVKIATTIANGENVRFSLAGNPLNELADGLFDVIPSVRLTMDLISRSKAKINSPDLDEGIMSLTSYPNPFRGEVNIVYKIPEDGKVNLSIISITGSKLKELSNERQSEGNYHMSFDGAALPPGVYLLTLRLNKDSGGVLTKTIQIIKVTQ